MALIKAVTSPASEKPNNTILLASTLYFAALRTQRIADFTS